MKRIYGKLVFDADTDLDHLRTAESALLAAGVEFDTGTAFFGPDAHGGREWELDWSLTGARLILYEDDDLHPENRLPEDEQ